MSGMREPRSPRVAWVPVAEAAAMLGVSRQRIHQLKENGQLVYQLISNTVLISVGSIEAREALMRDGRSF